MAKLNLNTATLADVLRHCADQLEAGEYRLNADEGDSAFRAATRQLVFGKGYWAPVGGVSWIWSSDDRETLTFQLPARWLPEGGE